MGDARGPGARDFARAGRAAGEPDRCENSKRVFAGQFKAELEMYPATISCKTLDRINHFTSFPEHIDFVAHLKSDVDVLNKFSNECKAGGWTPERQ